MSDNNNSNNHPHDRDSNGRPLFSMTMDPNAIEREIDHVAQELHSTVSSMLGMMQSSVFGGLESLSREVQHLEDQHRQFPWSIRQWTDASHGPKKRYRITIEEIPPTEDEQLDYQHRHQEVLDEASKNNSVVLAHQVDASGNEFSIQQGKKGGKDEGKTVITTTSSIAPGLLDWLLFTTHEDSFFRRLGRGAAEHPSQTVAEPSAKIVEIQEAPHDAAATSEQQQQQQQRPALVDKVKQVGAHWEQGARDWWHWGQEKLEQRHQQHHQEQDEAERRRPFWMRRENNHVLAGSGLEHEHSQQAVGEQRDQEERPRWRSWGRQESFSQTTVTHPDGTIESKTVSSLNGETETRTKLVRPDGTVEETVTRDGPRWGRHRNHHQRERLEPVMAAEEEQYRQNVRHQQQQAHEDDEHNSRSWPPKAWLRRQAQEQERND